MASFDVGIVGLGAMGSMAALELARRGHRVIGFDRFRPPHVFGSSHGESRIIREAYFEHPQYVPLVQRAYELWALLERESARRLLLPTGGLMLGPPDGTLITGARRSAETHGLPYEILNAPLVHERFPVFAPGRDVVGLLEPRAGVLFPEPALEAALELARAAGAELRFAEPVTSWSAGDSVTLRSAAGSYRVERLILAAGAWLSDGLAQAALPLRVARQTLFWFAAPLDGSAGPERMPVFIWEWTPGRMFYGFPSLGEGVKLAIHHEGESAVPDAVRREVDPQEAAPLAALLPSLAPALAGPLLRGVVCLYTNTPDGDFVLDRHPADRRVLIASPCSGHGFKFAPAIGELLADLVEDREPRFDLSPFRLSRFAAS